MPLLVEPQPAVALLLRVAEPLAAGDAEVDAVAALADAVARTGATMTSADAFAGERAAVGIAAVTAQLLASRDFEHLNSQLLHTAASVRVGLQL
jgi:hypothetical protein